MSAASSSAWKRSVPVRKSSVYPSGIVGWWPSTQLMANWANPAYYGHARKVHRILWTFAHAAQPPSASGPPGGQARVLVAFALLGALALVPAVYRRVRRG